VRETIFRGSVSRATLVPSSSVRVIGKVAAGAADGLDVAVASGVEVGRGVEAAPHPASRTATRTASRARAVGKRRSAASAW